MRVGHKTAVKPYSITGSCNAANVASIVMEVFQLQPLHLPQCMHQLLPQGMYQPLPQCMHQPCPGYCPSARTSLCY